MGTPPPPHTTTTSPVSSMRMMSPVFPPLDYVLLLMTSTPSLEALPTSNCGPAAAAVVVVVVILVVVVAAAAWECRG